MARFEVVAFPSDVARAARATLKDVWGEKVNVWRAAERPVPCRSCMHDTAPGGDLLLLKYSPFSAQSRSPYAERGPIFLCGQDCLPYAGTDRLPQIVATRQVNIRAYDKNDLMLYAHSQLADGRDADGVVARLLEDENVRQIHVRTALHGCFLCAVERS